MGSVIPYLCVDDCAAAIDFYTAAFGAKETMRLADPAGKIGHAEIQIGDSTIMMSDEYPEWGSLSPKTLGGVTSALHVSVDNADEAVERAAAAGATILQPVQDQFYGERSGQVRDPFGHKWGIAQHLEDVSPDEMQRRATEAFGST
jgi:PhnB protein